MATSSRQSALFGLQDWKRFYQTYRQADFSSYDYETLRKSFIDYLTIYYPETYNDYIESSEFVALLDVMAFMGQSLAFRDDLNTRENFIDTAERRDSVIKLANLVSYTPKRNTEANGLIKVTAVSTTESIFDINNVSLGNTTILWNDAANSNWQEQFNTILNSCFISSQRIGRPGNTQDLLGVQTDEYTVNITSDFTPVVPYVTQVNGSLINFELVSVTGANQDYLYELPPQSTGQFNMVYRNDKLGYGSPNTGFFFYFKQGTLRSYDFYFPEKIQNNIQSIDITGINNTDTWLFELNSDGTVNSQWSQVDNIYTTSYDSQGDSLTSIFSVVSRTNDQVNYVFGDGVFGEIPVGNYRAYVRAGNSLTYSIDPSEMNGIVVNIPYVSRLGVNEVLTVTISLQTVNNTAQARESISNIKERAPARYYTQNRMVNGEDYSNFPFTLYNSIIKSSALNRSSIGVSRSLDLLDPTGKYSSTNVFADDGALFTDEIDKTVTFSIQNINFAIEFLSVTLPSLLSTSPTIQYYQEYYPRYSGYYPGPDSSDNKCYWKQTTLDGSKVTGYFYVLSSSGTEIPIPLSTFSTYSMRYITQGAQLKFVSPDGYYFDSNDRLQYGIPNYYNGDHTSIWVGVNGVIGDGYNFGDGDLSTGVGPVTLNTYVPTGVYLDIDVDTPTAIIPQFDNTFDSTLTSNILDLINLKENFALVYDNTILITQERWSILQPIPTTSTTTNYFVTFVSDSINDSYIVNIRNTNYYFASVDQVRFMFDGTQRVYDQRSGEVFSDYVNIFKTNASSDNTSTLGEDYILTVIGQPTQSDGYPNDYQITVSSINPITGFTYDPDFFSDIVGTSSTAYVFFEVFTDINDLYRTQVLPEGTVIYAYSTELQVLNVIYEYPAETIFYCVSGSVTSSIPTFYQSAEVPGTQPTVLILNDVTDNYLVATGRGSINFQYRHNSDNTTRIDPATTNIIDLYLVTQAYYTQYQNWINDTTGTVAIPLKPTIQELQQAYGELDSYKMISDSVVLNSVDFKPLFGTKAQEALQGTIKVIKNPTSTVSDSEIRSSVLTALNSYFTIDNFDFGDTFYFSELTAYLHVQLGSMISSVVLVPANPYQSFGDLYEILSSPSEIFVNGATASDIIVISALTPNALQRTI